MDEEGRASPEDFDAWMASEQRRIFLLCLRMLRDRDEADSATQDAFLKAYRALRRQGAASIESPDRWLTRIAVNTCIEKLRSRRWRFWHRRPSVADPDSVLGRTPSELPTGEHLLSVREAAARLSAAIGRLSVRQRSVFVLRHDQGCTLEEIGGILGMRTGTVKAHMARAVSKLREELRDLYE